MVAFYLVGTELYANFHDFSYDDQLVERDRAGMIVLRERAYSRSRMDGWNEVEESTVSNTQYKCILTV